MLLTVYIIINMIANYIAQKIDRRIGDTSPAEISMLKFVTRFTLTMAVLLPFCNRIELMGLAVLGPLLSHSMSYTARWAVNLCGGTTISGERLIDDITQVLALSIVCLNLNALV